MRNQWVDLLKSLKVMLLQREYSSSVRCIININHTYHFNHLQRDEFVFLWVAVLPSGKWEGWNESVSSSHVSGTERVWRALLPSASTWNRRHVGCSPCSRCEGWGPWWLLTLPVTASPRVSIASGSSKCGIWFGSPDLKDSHGLQFLDQHLLVSCVTLGPSRAFSEPQTLHLWNPGGNEAWLWGGAR